MAFGDGLRDAIKEKSKEISDTLTDKYRERIGKELADREQKLNVREAEYAERNRQLNARELELVSREQELRRSFHVPKMHVFGILLLLLAAMGVLVAMQFRTSAVAAGGSADVSGSSASVQDQLLTESSCNVKGIAYYKEIGSYPRLSTGEDAERKVRENCSRTTGAFGR